MPKEEQEMQAWLKKQMEEEENAIFYAKEITRARLQALKAESLADFCRRLKRLLRVP